jgi:hypothetical protein
MLERKAFEDEDSLPDVAFGARRLAALAVSEGGTTKDEDDLVAAAARRASHLTLFVSSRGPGQTNQPPRCLGSGLTGT